MSDRLLPDPHHFRQAFAGRNVYKVADLSRDQLLFLLGFKENGYIVEMGSRRVYYLSPLRWDELMKGASHDGDQ